MTKGTKSYIHHARKTKWTESPDIDDNFKVKAVIKKYFKLIFLTDEVIEIPAGGFFNYRRPDLYNKAEKIVIELDGEGASGRHGWGDQLSTRRDERKDEDYLRAGVKCVHVNSASTFGYREDLVLKILQDSGVFNL